MVTPFDDLEDPIWDEEPQYVLEEEPHWEFGPEWTNDHL
jgi:hypothetical protein